MAIHPELDGLLVPVSELRPFAGNPRRGDLGAIKASLVRHGQYRPLVVNRPTMEVLAGNHTLAAALELGWAEIAVTFVAVDAEQAKRIVLVDNRCNDLAGYDEEALCELLEGLPDLDGTGFDETAFSQLLDEVRGPALGGEGDLLEVPKRPRSRVGDLFALGGHRLLCGDARSEGDLGRLMDGGGASLLWTDPPYGVSYAGKTKAGLRIENDDGLGVERLLRESFAVIDGALRPGAALYVCHPAGPLSLTFGRCFVEQGWSFRQTLVWAKDALVLGRGDYHYRHESILYGNKPGAGRRGRGGRGWYGGNAQTTLIEVERPKASVDHPTMKPVGLVEVALANSTKRGDVVLDPFGGSGSTLVACEAMGRSARLVELDRGYCDVIVARFETATGQRARRVSRR